MMIYSGLCLVFCLLARIRTWDPLIKSQLLYQLSYEEFSGCKDNNFPSNGHNEFEIKLGTFVSVSCDALRGDALTGER